MRIPLIISVAAVGLAVTAGTALSTEQPAGLENGARPDVERSVLSHQYAAVSEDRAVGPRLADIRDNPVRQLSIGAPRTHDVGVIRLAQGVKEKAVSQHKLRKMTHRAKQGDPDAQYLLGFKYEKGWGVDSDPGVAYFLFYIAAEQGHKKAAAQRDRLAATLTYNQLEEAHELYDALPELAPKAAEKLKKAAE